MFETYAAAIEILFPILGITVDPHVQLYIYGMQRSWKEIVWFSSDFVSVFG